MSTLGKLETLAKENSGFAADVAAAEFVRSVARSLKAMRERARFTQAQLGDAIGLTQGRVSQLESGLMDHAPNLETIALYANACGESVRLEASGEPQAEANPLFSFIEGKMAVDMTIAEEVNFGPVISIIGHETVGDFSPGGVAMNVPALAKLLEARNQLNDLVAYMEDKDGSQDLLGKVLKDPELMKALAGTKPGLPR